MVWQMAAKDDRKRIAIDIPLVKQIRLFLWAASRGTSKTDMAGRIVIDRVSNADNWNEVIRDLRQEAAIAQMPMTSYIANLLRGEFKELDVDNIDWSPLIESDAIFETIEKVNEIAAKKGMPSDQIWEKLLKLLEEMD